ncbi:MAG TPA: hypothetical protein VGE57_07040, partial [Solimonas sp.]
STLAVLCLLRQPWLGLQLAVDGDGLRVVAARGPATGVPVGTRLTALAADRSLVLHAGDLTPEPDTSHPDRIAFRDFLRRQQQLAALLAQPSITLIDAQGQRYQVEPAAARPLEQVPLLFWFQVLVGSTGLLIGVGVWTFRRTDPAARYLAITGVGLLLSAVAAAIYSSRELALPGSLFRVLHALNGTGSLLFCAAFVATLWHYPLRLGPRDPGAILIVLYLAIAAASALQWLPDFDIGLRLPILAGFTATIALAIRQWRHTRRRPLERAALQWFLLAWFSGSSAFLALVFVPALFGVDTGALQAYAFGLFLTIYAGLAFGIARYRLFQLDRWWLNAWSVLASGVVFAGVSFALIALTRLDTPLALALALAAAGWLHFPIRQRILNRADGVSGVAALPQLLQAVVATDDATPHSLWRDTLARLFRPLDIARGPAQRETAQIADNGLMLDVPGLDDDRSLRLTGCDGGRRLFNARDIEIAQTVHLVTERLLSYRRAVDIGVERERLRVARDLHDDVGARLLELLHATEADTQQRVRDILDELRLVIQSLGSNGERLEDLLGMCRAEIGERCESREVALDWRQPETGLPMPPLDPHRALFIARVLREGAANALRHARPDRLRIDIGCDASTLSIRIENNGVIETTAPPIARRGLNTLSGRAQTLGAALVVTAPGGPCWQIELQLPLYATQR